MRAGEASGALAVIFERLAEFERSKDELHSYIVSSMIYPGLLALVGLSSIFILLEFVVPRFAAMFSDSRMKIPAPTQFMLSASQVVQNYWWIGAGGLAAFLIFWNTYTRTEAGRLWWDGARLRLPLLGQPRVAEAIKRYEAPIVIGVWSLRETVLQALEGKPTEPPGAPAPPGRQPKPAADPNGRFAKSLTEIMEPLPPATLALLRKPETITLEVRQAQLRSVSAKVIDLVVRSALEGVGGQAGGAP